MIKAFSRFVPFIHLLPQECRDINEDLPENSFFYRAFDANIDTAKAVINTKYLQAMKQGTLSPDYYGGLTVLDSYYCYRAASTLDGLLCNIEEEQDPCLKKLTKVLADSYREYNTTFIKYWHIKQSDSVVPTETMKAYAEHEHQLMCYKDPIYTLVAYIPCYYLWPWFSQQIQQSADYNPGVYQAWFEGNYSGPGSFKSAERIGWLIEMWQRNNKPFDEDLAFSIYKTSMDFELKVFTEAWIKPKTWRK